MAGQSLITEKIPDLLVYVPINVRPFWAMNLDRRFGWLSTQAVSFIGVDSLRLG